LIDIQSLSEGANEYAYLGNRTDPHAGDALAAQDDILESKRLRRESKKRRKGKLYSQSRAFLAPCYVRKFGPLRAPYYLSYWMLGASHDYSIT
jgi:hypothetical protein